MFLRNCFAVRRSELLKHVYKDAQWHFSWTGPVDWSIITNDNKVIPCVCHIGIAYNKHQLDGTPWMYGNMEYPSLPLYHLDDSTRKRAIGAPRRVLRRIGFITKRPEYLRSEKEVLFALYKITNSNKSLTS